MTLPEITIRAFSSDQSSIDKYFYENIFQIKGFKDESEQPTVIDIGAGIGSFSFAAYALGAKKIYSIEPYLPNFKQLLKNTESVGNKIAHYNFGVYTEDDIFEFYDPTAQNGIFYDFSNIDIVKEQDGSLPYHIGQVITLNRFFKHYVTEQIDILKISIGYAEMDILENCSELSNWVESICGETESTPERIEQFKSRMREKGYNEFYIAPMVDEENKFVFLLSKTNIDKHFNIKK